MKFPLLKKLSEENPTYSIENRYREVYTFYYVSEDVVLMLGKFSYMRGSLTSQNTWDRYKLAYDTYLKETQSIELEESFILSFPEFIGRFIHTSDSDPEKYETYKAFTEKYKSLLQPEIIKYTMIDPSGGPFLMEDMEFYEGKYIDYFTPASDQDSTGIGFYIYLRNDQKNPPPVTDNWNASNSRTFLD